LRRFAERGVEGGIGRVINRVMQIVSTGFVDKIHCGVCIIAKK
jgi:hypothetical protein